MHLLAAQPGGVSDGSEAVDLGQTPGDIVVISAADTELTLLAQARAERPVDGFSSMRLANMMHMTHNMSVDLYVEDIIAHAKLVVLRILGGRGYWPYGCDEIAAICAKEGIPVAFLSGDDQPDAELAALSSLDADAQHRLWQYLVHGGPENALHFLDYAAGLIGFETMLYNDRRHDVLEVDFVRDIIFDRLGHPSTFNDADNAFNSTYRVFEMRKGFILAGATFSGSVFTSKARTSDPVVTVR